MILRLYQLRNIIFSLSLFLIWMGCEEDFIDSPPFEEVQDTVRLDAQNWYFFSPLADKTEDGVSRFPFSYNIFDAFSEGYLIKGASRVYHVDISQSLDEKSIFLDSEAQAGDTIQKFSDFKYHILIDKRTDPYINDDVYFILRRSKKGVRRFEERSVWVISPKKGLLAVANYDIDYRDGHVTLDMVGDPNYFREKSFITRLKYYDYDTAFQFDRDRNIIYEFNKFSGVLKSKDFKARKELFSYKFNKRRMSDLTDFRIKLESNSIQLIAGDSCFFFSESLELQRSTVCN